MQQSWALGTVTGAGAAGAPPALQRCAVRLDSGETAAALHDAAAWGPARVGQRVLLNTTAVALGLGTGGEHFVHAVLPDAATASLSAPPDRANGHIVKLRYTSLQRAVLAAEEAASPWHAELRGRRRLGGMPVLIGELHSMLPVAVSFLRRLAADSGRPFPRIAYVMGDGGALPLGLSCHAQRLTGLGWLAGTVTYGHAYGGDLETVNKFSALLAARYALQAELAIVAPGPGIVGTGTAYGHTGMETGELVNAAQALGGVPVVIARMSFADRRRRHTGLSRHTLTALADAAMARAIVPLPLLAAAQQRCVERQLRAFRLAERHDVRACVAAQTEWMEAALEAYGAEVTSMGRELCDDPPFYKAVCAAADTALRCLPSGR